MTQARTPKPGFSIDARSGTHRDRFGLATPVATCVRSEHGLYVAGRLPGHPHLLAYQHWLLPDQGWVVGRFAVPERKRPPPGDWYIDLDAVHLSGDVWQVEDRLVDVAVFDGHRYEIFDLDEFVDCIEGGSLSQEEGFAVLRSLHELCVALEDVKFSGAALIERYAPDLPEVQPWSVVLGAGTEAPLP